jgi:hypothetical protein
LAPIESAGTEGKTCSSALSDGRKSSKARNKHNRCYRNDTIQDLRYDISRNKVLAYVSPGTPPIIRPNLYGLGGGFYQDIFSVRAQA